MPFLRLFVKYPLHCPQKQISSFIKIKHMKINLEFPQQVLLIEIPQEDKFLIEECDGTNLLGLSHPLPNFNDPLWNKKGKPTNITEVRLYGVNDSRYIVYTQQAFLFLGRELDSLCLTQHQIKCFVENGVFEGSNHFCLHFLSRFEGRYGVIKVTFYKGKYSVNESRWQHGSDYGFPDGYSGPDESFVVVPV